jgi:hypothetical protein
MMPCRFVNIQGRFGEACSSSWSKSPVSIPRHARLYYAVYSHICKLCIFSPNAARAPSGPGPPRYRGFTFTLSLTPHIRYDSSGRVISPTQRPLPDNTQHSQERDIHTPGGIRTHNPSKRTAADPRLRPRGHWDRVVNSVYTIKIIQ